ncbi:hypothetical protein [Cognatiluteimonas profundi]|uniref:hypothetical protein n=1 Tax=Cognatiluteimonas profundi TaxID=2594501 RepID=UPI00131D856E|nr:hypothetical protein [Lysobacter profundi]
MRRLSAATMLFLLLLAAMAGAIAQQAAAWNPRTGDAWVDRTLDDVNRYGNRYPDAFVDELTRYLGAPRALVTGLLDAHWTPGDVYYACALAQVAGQPCRAVADAWTRDHAQGWGAIAQRYGVEPGSEPFHRLKRGLVGSYERWGRPLEIDDSLRADFPGRAPAAGVAAATSAPPGSVTAGGKRATSQDHKPPRARKPR